MRVIRLGRERERRKIERGGKRGKGRVIGSAAAGENGRRTRERERVRGKGREKRRVMSESSTSFHSRIEPVSEEVIRNKSQLFLLCFLVLVWTILWP